MGVSETQLVTWANAPGNTKAQFTYEQVKKALEASDSLNGRYTTYLQGSYANSTNIRIDSDIDIVVQLSNSWLRDISGLGNDSQQLYLSSTFPAQYHLSNFKTDVVEAVRKYFGEEFIQLGSNSIKLTKDEYRVNADIVACAEFRKYDYFFTHEIQSHIKGIKFYTLDGLEIINYPKHHLKNGEEKNKQHRTNNRYKHIVRIFKNIRKVLVDKYGLDPSMARSYYVECAIYNVPDPLFYGTLPDAVTKVLNYLLYQCNADSLIAPNHQHLLFGPTKWQWNKGDAVTFFKAAEELLI